MWHLICIRLKEGFFLAHGTLQGPNLSKHGPVKTVIIESIMPVRSVLSRSSRAQHMTLVLPHFECSQKIHNPSSRKGMSSLIQTLHRALVLLPGFNIPPQTRCVREATVDELSDLRLLLVVIKFPKQHTYTHQQVLVRCLA